MSQTSPAAAEHQRIPRISRMVLWTVAALGIVQFLQWTVVLPADVQSVLGFHRGDVDVGRWWTTLTFPLAHPDVTVLLLNIYALVLFGPRLEAEWGTARFSALLVAAAVGGWMLHLISGNTGQLLGASALAFAVLTAYAIRWGSATHLLAGGFEARGRWVTLFVGAMILLVGLGGGNGAVDGGGTGFLAHLGGIAAGWLFVRATPVLMVERLREGVSALPDEPPDDQLPRAIPKTLPRSRARDRETIDEVLSRTNAAAARRTTQPRRAKQAPQAEPPSIDAILEKISAEGIEQLTADERRALEDQARRLRDG